MTTRIVCAACGTESCWNGILLCDDARTAGTIEVSVADQPHTYGPLGSRCVTCGHPEWSRLHNGYRTPDDLTPTTEA